MHAVWRTVTHWPLLAPLDEMMYGAGSLVESKLALPQRVAAELDVSPASPPKYTSNEPSHAS